MTVDYIHYFPEHPAVRGLDFVRLRFQHLLLFDLLPVVLVLYKQLDNPAVQIVEIKRLGNERISILKGLQPGLHVIFSCKHYYRQEGCPD